MQWLAATIPKSHQGGTLNNATIFFYNINFSPITSATWYLFFFILKYVTLGVLGVNKSRGYETHQINVYKRKGG